MNRSIIKDFYYLMALEDALGREDLTVARSKLLEKVQDARSVVEESLAVALRDYLFLACSGEARHAASDTYIEQVGNWGNKSRLEAYQIATTHGPTDKNWSILESLFRDIPWRRGYGGEKWADLAMIGRMYGRLKPDAVFVDTAINGVHNNSSCLDKWEAMGMTLDQDHASNPQEGYNIKQFLDYKSHVRDVLEVDKDDILIFPPSRRVMRFISAYYKADVKTAPAGIIATSWEYTPVEWTYEGTYRYKINKYRNGVISEVALASAD